MPSMSFYPKFCLDKIWLNKHGRVYHLGKTDALKNGNFFLLFFPNKKNNVEAYGFFLTWED